MLALHRVWIDNEVLYREGLKLSGETGEGATRAGANREDVIFKALGVIDRSVRPSSVQDEVLRRWFESRRDQYERPASFDFEDAALSGDSSEAAVRGLVEELNRGAPASARASVRDFRGRPESNLVHSYGPEAAQVLAKAQPGTWLAMRARDGWRAVRLIAMTPKAEAEFEAERDAIRRDWIEATVAEKRSAAVQALRKKYKIEFAEKHRCIADE
jgi:hypothetical protein